MNLKRRLWIVAVAMIVVLVMFIPVVQAEPIDMLTCASGTITMIVASEELTIMSYEGKGINIDNLENKAFDNMTTHCVGVFKSVNKKMEATLYTKYMDPSGDFFVVDILQVGSERDWKFLYGTGKWKDVSGGGKALYITKGKPITPGTTQSCFKITGTYELKK
ncbi:MAG: hypothetical protein ABFD82_14645 [Syntrophaceae bacterium]